MVSIDFSTPTKRLGWFRFSLRTLFIVVAIFGGWLSWELQVVRERQKMRVWISQHHGFTVGFPTQGMMLRPQGLLSRFPRYRHLLGDEPVMHIGLHEPIPISDLEEIDRLFPEAMFLP
jgi:uncharacterized membrane protein YecN with MAPEG domain